MEVGFDRPFRHAKRSGHLRHGEIVEVAQRDSRSLWTAERAQGARKVEPHFNSGIGIGPIGHVFDGLFMPAPPTPPRDVRAVQGRAHVALEAIIIPVVLAPALHECGLEQILGVLPIPGEQPRSAEQPLTAVEDELFEAHVLPPTSYTLSST